MHVVQQVHQPLHQQRQQRLQLETGLHQLFDARYHGGVAGKHFALRRHHVRDEGVASALLLQGGGWRGEGAGVSEVNIV